MPQALIELSDLTFNWPGHPQLLDIPGFRLETGETLFLKGPAAAAKPHCWACSVACSNLSAAAFAC